MKPMPRLWTLVFLSGCASRTQSAPAPPPSPVLEVGYSALRISLPVLVAQSRGLFVKHDLNVQLKRYETAQPLVEEVLDGRISAGGYAALPIVFTAVERGTTRVQLLGAMLEDEQHPVSYLLRKKGDSAIQRVTDLRGKRVGVLPTLAYQKWLLALLEQAGVRSTDVHVVPLAPAQQVSGLSGNLVDALFTNDPMATSALALGVAEPFGSVAPLAALTAAPSWFGSFLLHEAFAQQRPRDALQLADALDEAVDFITKNQAAARLLMAPFVREAERGFVARYPPARYLKSTQTDAPRLEGEIASEVKLGILARAIPAKGWLFTRPQAPL